MLQIAICDDETLLLDEIKEITEGCMRQQQTFSILSTYTNGKDLFYDIQDGKRFDLLPVSYTHLTLPTKLEV